MSAAKQATAGTVFCAKCDGDLECKRCEGRGGWNPVRGTSDEWLTDCPDCAGKGVCRECLKTGHDIERCECAKCAEGR